MRTRIICLFVALLAASVSQANVITYDFTSTVGNGHFSFDDSTTTTVGQPPGPIGGGGVWYAAIDFVFGGGTVASPLIAVYDNWVGFDCLSVVASAGFPPGVAFCFPTSQWSGTALANVNNLTTADMLQSTGTAQMPGGPLGNSTSITRRATVPEPATIALLSLGLAGLGFSRRCRQ